MEDFLLKLLYILEANIILFVCQVFTIFVVLKLIVDKKSASNILAWLLAILFVPYIAIPFFFIFGRKDNEKSSWQKDSMSINQKCPIDINKYEKNNLPTDVINVFSSLKVPTLTSSNTFEIYTDGVESYKHFHEAIKNAKSSIYVQTYVFKHDTTSKLILRLLEKKASEGLEVKILIDSLGSFYTYRHQKRIFKNLRALGAEVVFFMPVLSNPFRNYINYRNHRKIYLIDNRIVFSGGMNIGDEYMSPMEHEGMWEDLLFKIEGESVNYFLTIFQSDWRFSTKKELNPNFSCYSANTNNSKENFIQVVPSGPDMDANQLYSGLITAINSAKEKLWIITPYLIPSQDLLQAIVLAKHRGIDVKIITPKKSNHTFIDRARTTYFRELLANNIEVHFTEKMMHAKAILIDKNLAMLGSVNLDNRSLFLNYEIATFVYSESSVAKVDKWAKNMLLQSSQDNDHISNKKSRLIIESIIKILTPLM
ncbi:cardiolipin synthase [Pseudofrancisella aestuarii]|uniref:Cardiolipin synthase n=1 Tax=Pseudofrancisella aestuarii TaxID=2670347 RepID=A0ABV9TAI4_9GAMM|nr:cardiolipin synthase [Pseudofrancisella aestuarii]